MSDTSHKIENTLFRKYFKLTLFSLIPLLFLAFVLEISARVVYFQMKAQDTFGLTIVYKTIKNIYLEKKAHSIIRDNVFDNLQSDRLTKEQIQALYSETGEELLREIHSRIEKNLYNILTTAGKIQSKLVVLYLPSDIENDKNRLFFEDVCRQYGIDFLDVIPILSEYGQDYYKLLPENDHLSRFGNKIVAEAIGQFITA